MKRKCMMLLTLLSAGTLLLQGCQLPIQTSGEIHTDVQENEEIWQMEYVDGPVYAPNTRCFRIYRDSETGVNYIIYTDEAGNAGMGGMCPRYNADGTLYVDSEVDVNE